MLPASDLSEILTNLAALNLQPNTAAQILAAVLAPLLRRSGDRGIRDPGLPERRHKRAGRLRSHGAPRRRKKARRRVAAAAAAATDGPRERARAAIATTPDASANAIAKAAGVSRSTVVNARAELAAEARREARRASWAKTATQPPERRERARQFLKEALGRGPKPVSDVEAAAAKAHVEPHALEQARADLGVVTSRGNSPGNAFSVQWSLPG